MPRIKPLDYLTEVKSLRDWSARAACPSHDPKLFDTTVASNRTVITEDTERAREICVGCPVMLDCLTHAAVFNIRTGIWGGLTVEERDEWAAQEALVAV